MEKSDVYYVVKKKAVPEVLLKVVKAKKLLETGEMETVQEAAEEVGISRSSYYKYKDDIFPFQEHLKGKIITWTFQIDDTPGLLSHVLRILADFGVNILTIHQSIPIDGVASLSLSVQMLKETEDISEMVSSIERQKGVRCVKMIAKE